MFQNIPNIPNRILNNKVEPSTQTQLEKLETYEICLGQVLMPSKFFVVHFAEKKSSQKTERIYKK